MARAKLCLFARHKFGTHRLELVDSTLIRAQVTLTRKAHADNDVEFLGPCIVLGGGVLGSSQTQGF
ncbi:MAG TPA: hypothetical protein EYN66_03225 [Myxococcales bacterium]|nr:hypothetical protein [Myxococcales bacterium]